MGRVIVTFPSPDSHLFNIQWEGEIKESQFLIAGGELLTIGERIREARIAKQVKVNVNVAEDVQPAPQQTGTLVPGQAPLDIGKVLQENSVMKADMQAKDAEIARLKAAQPGPPLPIKQVVQETPITGMM